MKAKLCIDCEYWQEGSNAEGHVDKCLHEKARRGGIRKPDAMYCVAMRAGICGAEGRHFEPKTEKPSSEPVLEFWLVQYPSGLLNWYKQKKEAEHEMRVSADRNPTLHLVREVL